MAEAKVAKTAYSDAKRVAKHAIWLAKSEAKKDEFATVSLDDDGGFRIAKPMNRTNDQDVVGEDFACNDAGQFVLTDEDKMRAWLSIMLGCSMSSLSGQVTSSPESLQMLASLPVCLWTRSRKHSANAAKLLAHLAS